MSPIILTLALVTASCALTMAIAMMWGHRRARDHRPAIMLMQDPRQCLHGFQRLGMTRAKSLTLPALTKEDHL